MNREDLEDWLLTVLAEQSYLLKEDQVGTAIFLSRRVTEEFDIEFKRESSDE